MAANNETASKRFEKTSTKKTKPKNEEAPIGVNPIPPAGFDPTPVGVNPILPAGFDSTPVGVNPIPESEIPVGVSPIPVGVSPIRRGAAFNPNNPYASSSGPQQPPRSPVSSASTEAPIGVNPVLPMGYNSIPVGVNPILPAGFDSTPVGVNPIPQSEIPVGVNPIPRSGIPTSPRRGAKFDPSNPYASSSGPLQPPRKAVSNSFTPMTRGMEYIKRAVSDKNGSAKSDGVSGVASGMGASNPSGSKTPKSSQFSELTQGGSYDRPFVAMKGILPQGYMGVGHLDGSYTVIGPDNTKHAFNSEKEAAAATWADNKPTGVRYVRAGSAAQQDAAGEPITNSAEGLSRPATEDASYASAYDNPANDNPLTSTTGNPAIDNLPADKRDRFFRDNPGYKPRDYVFTTEAGAPNGMGSLPTGESKKLGKVFGIFNRESPEKARAKDSGWRKRKSM